MTSSDGLTTNSRHCSLLTVAAEEGRWKSIKTLLQQGADVNAADSSGRTALMYAAMYGHDKCVRALVQAGAGVNRMDCKQKTALVHAAEHGHSACLKELIDAGADTSLYDEDSATAVMHATRKGSVRCLEILMNAGAYVHLCMWDGTSPLSYAASKGMTKCVEVLLKAEPDGNYCYDNMCQAVIETVYERKSRCLDMLIKAGADVDAMNSRFETALMLATEDDRVKTVAVLLRAGADVNVNHMGRTGTALMRVVKNRNLKILMMLLRAGANVNITGYRMSNYKKDGFDCHLYYPYPYKDNTVTALLLAANLGSFYTMVLLVRAGANVNIADDGNTPLHLATFLVYNCGAAGIARRIKCIKLLLAAGAHVNQYNSEGRNALRLHLEKNLKEAHPLFTKMALVLFAAGDTIEGDTVRRVRWHRNPEEVELPESMRNTELKMCLKHLCREAIRKQMLVCSPVSLYRKVPRLGLPRSLQEYLLYDVSLSLSS